MTTDAQALASLLERRDAAMHALKRLRREALDVCLEVRALDHAIRARSPSPGQSAPSNPYASPSLREAPGASLEGARATPPAIPRPTVNLDDWT